MIDRHYPERRLGPARRETLERLAPPKARRGLPTFDASVAELLDATDEGGGGDA